MAAPARPSRRKRFVERALLGTAMSIAAWVIDRKLRKAIRRKKEELAADRRTATFGPEGR